MGYRSTWPEEYNYPPERDHVGTEWQQGLEREVREGQRLGLGREEITRRVALWMYRRDLRDFGWAVGLGFFTSSIYYCDAKQLVDTLMRHEPDPASKQRAEGTIS